MTHAVRVKKIVISWLVRRYTGPIALRGVTQRCKLIRFYPWRLGVSESKHISARASTRRGACTELLGSDLATPSPLAVQEEIGTKCQLERNHQLRGV